MLLNKHERRYKRFIALNKEWNKVWEAQRNLPWTEVSKPFQDGWFIYLDFHDEVKRREDYPFLRMVLDLSAREGRTRDPKMVGKIRKCKRLSEAYKLFPYDTHGTTYPEYSDSYTKSWYYSNHYGVGSPPTRGRIRKEDAEKLPAGCNKWIYKVVDEKTNSFQNYRIEYYRDAIPSHFLKMKIRKAMVTHVKDIDPNLQRKQAEIDKELDVLRYDFMHRYHRDKYSNLYGRKAYRAAQRAEIQKVLKGEHEEFELKKKIRNYD